MKVSGLLPFFSTCVALAAAAPAAAEDDSWAPLSWFAPPSQPNADAKPRRRVSAPSTRHKIPTSYESAVMGRRILALTPLATFSTVFPAEAGASLDGVPIGLSDYIADCEEEGNPTILSLKVGTSFQNVRHGSNISVSLAWVPPYPPARRIRSEQQSTQGILSMLRGEEEDRVPGSESEGRPDPMPYSGANLPRFSLIGYLEKIDHSKDVAVTSCYVGTHPDAKYWLPGNPIHEAEWVRLVVTKVYWIGGFGDRAYIGWIPVEQWKSVSRDEWEGIRLPGEKPGWREWSVDVEREDVGEL